MMTRHLALLLLSASLTYCMETKETVQRMVMVRTTGSDIKPETKGFIYKRESDGPPKVINLANNQVLKKLSQVYVFPQAFDAPISYAAGPFYNKEEDLIKAGSNGKKHVIPLFENIDSKDYKEDSVPAAAEIPGGFASEYIPQSYEDFSNDFNEYLVSLGYHDDFYRIPGDDYGKIDHSDADAVKSSPSHYRYAEGFDNDDAGKFNSEKYEILTLGTTQGSKKASEIKNTHSPLEYKYQGDSDKAETLNREKLNIDFRKENYNDDHKLGENKRKEVKKVDKYDGDFYDYKKDDFADDVKVNFDIKRFAGGYDYTDSEGRDDERAVAEDLNGQIADELRDCCYEEKPGHATTDSDIRVKRGHNYIYKIVYKR